MRQPGLGAAGGGEAAGPLWPPEALTEDALGAGHHAAAAAYAEAGASAADIDFFGLYARPMLSMMQLWLLCVWQQREILSLKLTRHCRALARMKAEYACACAAAPTCLFG